MRGFLQTGLLLHERRRRREQGAGAAGRPDLGLTNAITLLEFSLGEGRSRPEVTSLDILVFVCLQSSAG